MKRFFLISLLFVLAAGCAKPVPTSPPDPAYRFQPDTHYRLTFAERIAHRPRTTNNPRMPRLHVMEQATMAEFDLDCLQVRPDGAALLRLQPISGHVRVGAHGRPPLTYELAERRRDPDDHSDGARYLSGLAASGLFVVVDNTGRRLRDYRGLTPLDNFLTQDDWKKTPGLTVYPNDNAPKHTPVFLQTHLPLDWRRQRAWNRPANLVVFPPATGYLPVKWTTRLTRREGSILTLTGQALSDGRPVTRPTLQVVPQGDRTTDLEFVGATYEARFDLDWGLPLESKTECKWISTREVAGVGTVVADDTQVLTFKLRKRY